MSKGDENMPKLRCCVRNCSYNKEDYCSLNYIEIDGNQATNDAGTCCTYFDSSAYAASNMHHDIQPEVSIKCSAAGCIHNRDAHCGAQAVNIAGATTANNSHDTKCANFWCI